MSLLVIIVNYKTPDLTIDALRSLAPEIPALPPTRVVVVENGSQDDSPQKLSAAIVQNHWTWCQLLPLEKNLGFAAGNNIPLRSAGFTDLPPAPPQSSLSAVSIQHSTVPDFILLLNPDTLLRESAIKTLLDFLQQNPHIAIAGSRLEDPDATPQRSAFKFPNYLTELNDTLRMKFLPALFPRANMAPPVRDQPHPTDWVAGASMLIRREVFQTIGLLDESFFVYFEEVDFCFRARRAGFPTWYVPQSRVVHLIGQASNVNTPNTTLPRRPRYWFDARKNFYKKNYGPLPTLLANLAYISGLLLYRLRRRIIKKPTTDTPHLLRDFLKYNFLPTPQKSPPPPSPATTVAGIP